MSYKKGIAFASFLISIFAAIIITMDSPLIDNQIGAIAQSFVILIISVIIIHTYLKNEDYSELLPNIINGVLVIGLFLSGVLTYYIVHIEGSHRPDSMIIAVLFLFAFNIYIFLFPFLFCGVVVVFSLVMLWRLIRKHINME